MAQASAHHKQVKDFMRAEMGMKRIKKWQFECIDHAADRIDDASGKQPDKLCGMQ